MDAYTGPKVNEEAAQSPRPHLFAPSSPPLKPQRSQPQPQQRGPSPLGRAAATPLPNAFSPSTLPAEDNPPPETESEIPQLPSLASRSAPISATISAPSSSHSLLLLPTHPAGPLHGSSFHTGSHAGPKLRPSLLAPRATFPSTAELARKLRGMVMNAAVNFRDVELMPQPPRLDGDDTEGGDMEGLMDQQGEEPDADAATGSMAVATAEEEVAESEAADEVLENGDGRGGVGPTGSGMGEVVSAAAAPSAAAIASGLGAVAEGGGAAVVGPQVLMGYASGSRSGGVSATSRLRTSGAVVRKNKLVIILVGLPGRGKTFLCNKLCCYLNWLGHATRHFNVGSYRRRQRPADQLQDAAFFDPNNEAGLEARSRALYAALDDMMAWLRSDVGQVAVFDATNTTESRRNLLRSKFHGQWQYLFIETICSDPAVLEQNYRNKMKYSPDYKGVDTDKAVADFLERICKYEQVYEPINDRNLHYIKLIDMVTGRGHMDINRISGYLPGKIVFFLMQICKAGMTSVRKIWLSRHGESEYNQKGLIGGNSSLSERGERYSRALPEALIARLPQEQPISVAVWTSTLKRTIETARFLPFPKLSWKALDEIDAGICDGMTYEQIAQKYPQEYHARKKDKLRYRYPSGESYMDVIQRVEPVIIELERERESVLVVAHQAVLRAVYAYFMNVPPDEIPRLNMPLHTLIELTPMPDGTMSEQRFAVDIDRELTLEALAPVEATQRPGAVDCVGPGSSGSGTAVKGGLAGNGAEEQAMLLECLAPQLQDAAEAAAATDVAAPSGSPLSSVNSGSSCMLQQEAAGGGPLVLPASPASSPSSGENGMIVDSMAMTADAVSASTAAMAGTSEVVHCAAAVS